MKSDCLYQPVIPLHMVTLEINWKMRTFIMLCLETICAEIRLVTGHFTTWDIIKLVLNNCK